MPLTPTPASSSLPRYCHLRTPSISCKRFQMPMTPYLLHTTIVHCASQQVGASCVCFSSIPSCQVHMFWLVYAGLIVHPRICNRSLCCQYRFCMLHSSHADHRGPKGGISSVSGLRIGMVMVMIISGAGGRQGSTLWRRSSSCSALHGTHASLPRPFVFTFSY